MAFPDAWLDELLAKNDIVSVVSSYVELRPKGRRLWGLCPLHGEKTPSFSVSPGQADVLFASAVTRAAR